MVDPISIVAAVAAVVSAFKDGWGLFQKWRRKKSDENKALVQDEFDQALIDSPDDVQKQYDNLSRLAGPEFAQGDRDAIRAVLRSMELFNRTVIQGLQSAIRWRSPLSIDHLLSTTNSLRKDTISNLVQLFQRFRTSKPIPRNPSIHTHNRWDASADSPLALSTAATRALTYPIHDFADFAAPAIPPFVPMDTRRTMRSNVERISSMTFLEPQHTTQGLRDSLNDLHRSWSSGVQFKGVDLNNLESERLLQTLYRGRI